MSWMRHYGDYVSGKACRDARVFLQQQPTTSPAKVHWAASNARQVCGHVRNTRIATGVGGVILLIGLIKLLRR
jgi:hypothetical protein